MAANWTASNGLFWITGKRAYNEYQRGGEVPVQLELYNLHSFLLPKSKGECSGLPLYETLRRRKQTEIGGKQT